MTEEFIARLSTAAQAVVDCEAEYSKNPNHTNMARHLRSESELYDLNPASALLKAIAQRAELLDQLAEARDTMGASADVVLYGVPEARKNVGERLRRGSEDASRAITRATQSTGEATRDDSEDWYCEAQLEEIARKERGEV